MAFWCRSASLIVGVLMVLSSFAYILAGDFFIRANFKSLAVLLGVRGFLLLFSIYVAIVGGNLVVDSLRLYVLLKLHVGILVEARNHTTVKRISSIQLQRILQTTTSALLALLAHPSYFVFGHSSVDKVSILEILEQFNKHSDEAAQEKLDIGAQELFDVEVLKNVKEQVRKENNGNEYIVVTILVASTSISHTLPGIKDRKSLREALRILGSLDASTLTGVHVVWTPQNHTLVEEELHQRYPLLMPILE